jgi:hypothetical protein
MKRWLCHPAVKELYPGLLVLGVLLLGFLEGWGK